MFIALIDKLYSYVATIAIDKKKPLITAIIGFRFCLFIKYIVKLSNTEFVVPLAT